MLCFVSAYMHYIEISTHLFNLREVWRLLLHGGVLWLTFELHFSIGLLGRVAFLRTIPLNSFPPFPFIPPGKRVVIAL